MKLVSRQEKLSTVAKNIKFYEDLKICRQKANKI